MNLKRNFTTNRQRWFYTTAFLLMTSVLLAACVVQPVAPGSNEAESEAMTESATSELPSTAMQEFEACDAEFVTIDPNPNFPWTPNAVELLSEEVADNVFAIYDANFAEYEPVGFPLATSGGFVIGEEGVLIIDTMINRRLLCQVYELIRAETELPILYAVNTSHHGDHSYGNAFLPDEVQVVQHENTAKFISEFFEEDVAFMEANFGTDQGIDEVTATVADITVDSAGWSVDLGGITVEAQYHGFGQTDGDLFVYVPKAKVMWAGNPLIAEAPAIPWLLDGHAEEVVETLKSVQASLPADATVVPGHGQPTTPDAFNWSIDYLSRLITDVQASIGAGDDVEATQAAVVMDEFQGYALWDWVHKVVNVPNTYAELSDN